MKHHSLGAGAEQSSTVWILFFHAKSFSTNPFLPHKESKRPLWRKPSLGHQGGHRGGLGGGCHISCVAQPQLVPLSCSLCHPVHGFWSLGGAQGRGGAGVALLAQGFAGPRPQIPSGVGSVGLPLPLQSCGGAKHRSLLQLQRVSGAFSHRRGTLQSLGPSNPPVSWHRNELMRVAGLLSAEQWTLCCGRGCAVWLHAPAPGNQIPACTASPGIWCLPAGRGNARQ